MKNEVYEPREDSLLLEKHVKKLARGNVLDTGTGSGIQAKAAAAKADSVTAVDISQKAIDFCRKNIKSDKIKFIKSDLFSSLDNLKFDTIIFNPQYLPEEKCEDVALDGGKMGYEIIERFLGKAKEFLVDDGIILIVFSSLTGKEKVDEMIIKNGFEPEELERIHISFEDIYCYKIIRS